MIGLGLALLGAYGVFLLFTAVAFGWRGVGLGPGVATRVPRRRHVHDYLVQAGLEGVRPIELGAVMAVLAVLGGLIGFLLFPGYLVPVAVALLASVVPVLSARARREARLEAARDAWPRLIEEIRLQATTMGKSIPNALLTVGLSGPEQLRPSFEAAHREWLISTDFPRTVAVLKARLADPTADVVCETLLVAHEVGGTDLDARLTALAEDRTQDLQGRKDARAKQAGARFARWFVLVVPVGMALAGLSIGEGREAYATPTGQLWVLAGIALIAVCWLWAGRIMRLPAEGRVFHA
ncbi:hypothetical protein ER308_11015 [Egibacter rhizosphaerae]|uniref:Type II secretion system protein GspF domain-containing protein n=1 Tax=Egibacter rhizosphaerae TaxID=1670831 RepID=A0A411YFX0_9ACTN|nr:hypothetical protein [Egibacter rhizosphaerae]QBI20037.1 hypothetical protein ER308_11015 [Egibacter rhizosphaerae]